MSDLDEQVTACARQIAGRGEGDGGLFHGSWLSERMLEWAMSHPSFRTQLFRFVDVLPATTDSGDVARHLHDYFDAADAPWLIDAGLSVADHLPFGRAVSATVARRSVARIAEQFIVGTDAGSAREGLERLWRSGRAFTVDLLGEKTVTAADADRYTERLRDLIGTLVVAAATWAPDDHLDRDDRGAIPRVSVSIKPTALAPHYGPLTAEIGLREARERLDPILRWATEAPVFVYLDMEHHDVKDLTLELARRLAVDPTLGSLHLGVVVQAYLKDSYDDLRRVIDLSSARSVPLTVRLVKGAYWDTETIRAQANGWSVPVFERKDETDANYERCVDLLLDHHGAEHRGAVRAAFASHNLRSLAYAITGARRRGIPDGGYEIQMLHGMAESIQSAIVKLGLRLRVYAPVGALVPGMAYLVRRLLENTSNESFVRHRFAEQRDLDDLLEPPGVSRQGLSPPGPMARRHPTDPSSPAPYEPEPPAEWHRADVRADFGTAVADVAGSLGFTVPAVVGADLVTTGSTIPSLDPARPDRLICSSASCGPVEADAAIDAAIRAWPAWRDASAGARAAVLFRAAEWMRSRRRHLAALEVLEAGKPWRDADLDVCEAIDFLEYYGREMRRLDGGGVVDSPPGEANTLRYHGIGLAAVIAPWNFPLAIPTGMVSAALVAGNCVLFKPAEQTPAVAWRLVEALRQSGLPDGVLAFLPGIGEVVGAHLVAHPMVNVIAFTGSKAVGLHINEEAARHRPGQRHVKRVIAEMGGKNALIVDSDADLDQAVPIVVQSAFGYAGQKCSAASRLVVLDTVYEACLERLTGAVEGLRIGPPEEMETEMGPVIDAEARDRIRAVVAGAPAEGRVVVARTDVPATGWFVGPLVVDRVATDSPLARDEIFGPVLTVFRADDFEHALSIANDTEYALTAGVVSRSPHNIALAAARLRAGNVYVNRAITGAVVGRQPFGGHGLSGVGSKAGGPDYLAQFLQPRVISENTIRQGFAPLT